MGLDIYFVKRRLAAVATSKDNLWNLLRGREDAYFRKVNFIYAYFQDSIDAHEACVIDKMALRGFLDVCREVLKRRDNEYSQIVLPTCNGFFFGSTDYDDGYYMDVEDCINQLSVIAQEMTEEERIVILFSW